MLLSLISSSSFLKNVPMFWYNNFLVSFDEHTHVCVHIYIYNILESIVHF